MKCTPVLSCIFNACSFFFFFLSVRGLIFHIEHRRQPTWGVSSHSWSQRCRRTPAAGVIHNAGHCSEVTFITCCAMISFLNMRESERLSHTSMVMRPIWSTYFPKQNRIQHGWLVLPLKALIWHGRAAQSPVNGSCLNTHLAALFGYAEKRAYGVFFCTSQGNACFWTCPLLYKAQSAVSVLS